MKGLPPSDGPRSRRARGPKKKPAKPIELPPMDDDEDLVDFGLDDPHSRMSVSDEIKRLRAELGEQKKETERCWKCHGQGRVPSAKFCGAGKECPECKGTGHLEFEPVIQVDLAEGETLPILPGDVDFDDAEPKAPKATKTKTKKSRSRRPSMPGTLAGERKRKSPKKKPAKKTKDDDIPPWEKLGDNAAPWD